MRDHYKMSQGEKYFSDFQRKTPAFIQFLEQGKIAEKNWEFWYFLQLRITEARNVVSYGYFRAVPSFERFPGSCTRHRGRPDA